MVRSVNAASGYEFDRLEYVPALTEVGYVGHEDDNRVNVWVNGRPHTMKVDSGCRRTLIPVRFYEQAFGSLTTSDMKFRPYGTQTLLEVEGEVDVTLTSESGANHSTTVYIINGEAPDILLGDTDAKSLGILTINKNGRIPNDGETVSLVTSDLKANGIRIMSERESEPPIGPDEQGRIDAILDNHENCFRGVGLLVGDEAHFHIDPTVPPVCAPYRPMAIAYQAEMSKHLQELRDQDKIEDINPDELCEWTSNVVVTHKKEGLRMNIDMREPNKALKRTKVHIETVTEIRHKLKGATRFSEMDMSHGYHQIKLAEDSRNISTFRTHEGLHRFKVLFFGAKPASDIFHQKIKNALAGLEGCVSIHDNILVWGDTPEEHERNLDACLTRIAAKGLTLRREKCSFGKTYVTWFGWVFSKSGISADPAKMEKIKEAGRPTSTDDVKSFLQACQFNAKFMYNTDQAYAELTKPLRDLLKKDCKFTWSAECERAYQKIMQGMTSSHALRPHDPEKPTAHVADAGPNGIASSVFQIESDGTWSPVDHASRSLTACEQK